MSWKETNIKLGEGKMVIEGHKTGQVILKISDSLDWIYHTAILSADELINLGKIMENIGEQMKNE